MTEVLLNSLVPIFAIIALGYFAGWVRDIDNHHVAELNALVMDFALPASLFVATASTSRAMLLAQWPLLVVLIIPMLALYGVCYWMQRRLFRLESSAASVQALTISLPNFAAAGLPLIAAVFGSTNTIYVALAIAAGAIVLSPLTLAILEANKAAAAGETGLGLLVPALARSLTKPIVIGPIAGILFSLIGIPLPDYVVHAFQLIGQTAGGVALFLTGLILSAQKLLLNSNVISAAVIKNIAHPLIAVLLIMLVPMPHDTARAAILLSALPSGFFGVLFGLRYGVDSREAGSTLIVSSVFGVLTLTGVLVLTAGS